ncbi:SusD/RagB family nutrient-binding outer membrane lipoprotein [Saccharicrinis aurantiacus]|uniref:SusD/RagB family nutrient-binding outer membrane lipoprotein n=1 Tax=Saccharicrinis aurantiacus TaxID=1849719 RepID=UPI0024908DE1|nr:SusD/RagB family nutrient-binding outer membrane lipoprotein [Saccharicrinis aurantiacus]
MKNIFKYILVLVAAFSIVSCEKDFLDINVDPNNPAAEEGTPELIFPAAVASSAVRIGGEYAILGGMWSQFWTQSNAANQYKYIDQYNVTTNNLNGSFQEIYAGALNDYNAVINKAEETENWIYYLMGTVMKAYTMQVMADLYDNLPYSEAFMGNENLTPSYDNGSAIYDALLAELDVAMATDLSSATNSKPGSKDFIFNGDVDSWLKFANTLKLKMYLRMVNVDPTAAENGVKAVFSSGIGFISIDAAMTQFEDAPDKSNPFYEYNFRQLNVATNLRASNTMMSYLISNGDPRIDAFYKEGSEGHFALYQGQFSAPSTEVDPDKPSVAKQSALEPVRFISAAESYFMQAEAVERYGVAGDAKALYDLGVQAAFSQFDFDPVLYGSLDLDPTNLIAVGGSYEYPTGAFEDKLEAIITQKWLSCVGSHSLEAYFETNRTGYPKYSAVKGSDPTYVAGELTYSLEGVTSGKFPKRVVYPDIEYSRNPNTPEKVDISTNVWWAK